VIVAERRVAGSDTREALATPTVRAAVRAAMLGSAPGWAVAFGAAGAWEDVLALSGTGLWLTPLMLVLGAAIAIAVWRSRHILGDRPSAAAIVPVTSLAVFGIVIAASGDATLAAVSLPIAPLVGGFTVAAAAAAAVRACVPGVRPAAAGIVAIFGLVGVVPGLHILLVGTGSGLPRASGWSAAYLILAAITLARAGAVLPADLRKIALRQQRAAEPADTGHALAMRGVSVRFGSNLVLDEAALLVEPGELVALVGANGAGKSTLLRVAAGFVPLETGQVMVGDEDVSSLQPEERAGAGLSFVSGARPVFPELTVMQNLRVAAYRTHKTPSSFDQATEALLELIPTLAERRDDMAGVLSGGEQRLLAVAQTMYRKPRVLLADELTLGLDVDARLAVMDLLQTLAHEGVAVVAVDHDLPALLPRATRAALLADGTVTSWNDPAELLTRRADLLPATFLAGAEG